MKRLVEKLRPWSKRRPPTFRAASPAPRYGRRPPTPRGRRQSHHGPAGCPSTSGSTCLRRLPSGGRAVRRGTCVQADGGSGGVGRSVRGSTRPPRLRTVQPKQVLARSEGSLLRAARHVVRENAALRAGVPPGAGKREGGGESGEGGGGDEGGDRHAAARRRRSRIPRPGRVLRRVDWRQTRSMCRVARAHAAPRAAEVLGAWDQSTMRAAPRCFTPRRPSSAS